jgi:hypothetical protein
LPPKGQQAINRKFNRLTGSVNTDISFSTLKYPLFNWVQEIFYVKVNNNNIKIVPADSYNRMSPVSLVY